MALTANGIGSGLDINGLVSQLMTVEQRPLTALASKEASYQAKLSAFGQLKSVVSALQTAANSLKDATKFSATKTTVGADAAFTASSTTSAAVGSYTVEVSQLAKVQRIATSSTVALNPTAGDLAIDFGSVTGGIFTADPARSKTLTFAGGSIEALRDAINGGDLGVTASVVNNGTVKQLVLTGKNTGTAEAFKLGGTVGLSYNPEVSGTASDPVYRVQAAQNAQLKVDGITISRSSNTVSDAIEGVTLTLTKENAGVTSSLTVASDRGGARSAIDAFVKAYNDVNKTIKDLTAFNAETRRGSTLTGDSTARSVQGQVRSLVGGALTGLGVTSRLSEIGISFKSDGTLAVDGSKLDAALSDPARGVAAFFTGTEGVTGFAETVSTALDGYISSTGLLAGRTDGINASVKLIGKQREALIARLEQTEKRYRAQFTALDSTVASMTQTSNYLAQQLANLPKSGE